VFDIFIITNWSFLGIALAPSLKLLAVALPFAQKKLCISIHLWHFILLCRSLCLHSPGVMLPFSFLFVAFLFNILDLLQNLRSSNFLFVNLTTRRTMLLEWLRILECYLLGHYHFETHLTVSYYLGVLRDNILFLHVHQILSGNTTFFENNCLYWIFIICYLQSIVVVYLHSLLSDRLPRIIVWDYWRAHLHFKNPHTTFVDHFLAWKKLPRTKRGST